MESNSLAHVIGYVGDITHEELQVLYNQGYEPGDVLGKSGIEKEYDHILRGKDGIRFRVVDVQGAAAHRGGEEAVVPPEPGRNVVLTIDRKIQKLAEQALGPRNGSVVVLRPSTGEILAMVSYPSFDPNRLFAADRRRLLYQAHPRPFLSLLQPRHPGRVPARLDVQDHHDNGDRRRRNDPDQPDGAVHGKARVRRPRLQLLAEDRPRLPGPPRRAGAVLRRVLLHHGQ